MHGGVGRNVAANLSYLGQKNLFVSTVDASGLGEEVLHRLRQHQVDLTYTRAVPRQGMGMWLAVLDAQGDLAGSISQMPDLTHLENTINNQGEAIISQVQAVVLEIDLNVAIATRVAALAEAYSKPLYGLVGNLSVIRQCPQLLASMDCFVCNELEAQALTGAVFADIIGAQASVRQLTATGLKRAVITLGAEGAVFYDAVTGESGYQPALPVTIVDTSGAGDAFFSGTVCGLMRGDPLQEAVALGTRVAAWTIASMHNTNAQIREYWQKGQL